MKTTACALVALLLFTSGAATSERAHARATAPGDETELARRMQSIEELVLKLRRSLRDDAARVESLEQVARLEAETLAAKGLVPALAAELEDAQRPVFAADYRRSMLELLAAELELERALLDGDRDAAKAAFDKVRGAEDPGHRRFTREG